MGSASAISRSDMTLLCPADIFSARNLRCPTARIAHTTTASRTRSRRGDRRTCIEGLLPEGLIAALGAPPSRPLPLSQSGATPRAGARQRRRHAACFSLVRAVAALLLTVGSFQFRKPAKPTSRYAANKKPAAIVRTDTVPSQSVRRFPFPNRGIASSSFQSSCFVG